MNDLFRPPALSLGADHIAYQADALELTSRLSAGCVHLTITDPAYPSLEKHRAVGTTTRLTAKWFDVVSYDYLGEWLRELYRVHSPKSHAYVFGDDATIEVLRPMARAAGWWAWKAMPWVKTKRLVNDPTDLEPADVRIGTGYHWRASHELVLFLEKRTSPQPSNWTPDSKPKGKGRQLNSRSWPDVLVGPPVRGHYPTQKPTTVVERLLRNSSAESELVFDPFAGSGIVGRVAENFRRRFVLGEKRPRDAGDTPPLALVPWECTEYRVLEST